MVSDTSLRATLPLKVLLREATATPTGFGRSRLASVHHAPADAAPANGGKEAVSTERHNDDTEHLGHQ